MPQSLPLIRIFLSSPGDVAAERDLAEQVVDALRVQPGLHGKVAFDLVRWDRPGAPPMEANLTPQAAIDAGLPRPSECDIVVVILWSRMGTPVTMAGVEYESGTHYEYVDAMRGLEQHGRPRVLVYRCKSRVNLDPDDPDFDDRVEQYRRVKAFFARFRDDTTGQLIGGVNEYDAPDDFRALLEAHLQHLVMRLVPDLLATGSTSTSRAPASSAPPLWDGSPFPGLRAFGPEDAPIFFGRGPEIDALARAFDRQNRHFLAVVGASGSGKSSLVGAGLVPRLLNTSAENTWHLLRFTPDELGAGDPFAALAAALLRDLNTPAARGRTRHLARDLREDPTLFSRITADHMTAAGLPDAARLLVFIDQFEELFTTVREEFRDPFIRMIDHNARTAHLYTVVTLRGDFYGACVEDALLASLLEDATFPLAAPGAAALYEMVARPAARAGLTPEDGLIDRILRDTGDEPGALALMAYALDELYRRRTDDGLLTFAAYAALGGVQGAIGERSEAVFQRLIAEEPAVEKALFPVFRELVEVDERGTATRQRAPFRRVVQSEAAHRLVQAFADQDARLLVNSRGIGNHPYVEVAHEALLRSWQRLADWIEITQDDLRLLRQVRLAAEEWDANDRADAYLWMQERLEEVYAMRQRLGIEFEPPVDEFIRPETDYLVDEFRKQHIPEHRRLYIIDRLKEIGESAVPAMFAALIPVVQPQTNRRFESRAGGRLGSSLFSSASSSRPPGHRMPARFGRFGRPQPRVASPRPFSHPAKPDDGDIYDYDDDNRPVFGSSSGSNPFSRDRSERLPGSSGSRFGDSPRSYGGSSGRSASSASSSSFSSRLRGSSSSSASSSSDAPLPFSSQQGASSRSSLPTPPGSSRDWLPPEQLLKLREELLKALGKFPQKALAVLTEALSDGKQTTRLTALDALIALAQPAADPPSFSLTFDDEDMRPVESSTSRYAVEEAIRRFDSPLLKKLTITQDTATELATPLPLHFSAISQYVPALMRDNDGALPAQPITDALLPLLPPPQTLQQNTPFSTWEAYRSRPSGTTGKPELRRVLEVLARLRDPRAVPTLIDLAQGLQAFYEAEHIDDSASACLRVIIEKALDPAASSPQSYTAARFRGTPRDLSPRVENAASRARSYAAPLFDTVIALILSSDPAVIPTLLDLLGRVRIGQLRAILIEGLVILRAHRDPAHAQATEAAYIAALYDESPEVVVMAAGALAAVGTPECIPALRDALDAIDHHTLPAITIDEAVLDIIPPDIDADDITPEDVRSLVDKRMSQVYFVAAALADALGRMQASGITEPLLRLMTDDMVGSAAADAARYALRQMQQITQSDVDALMHWMYQQQAIASLSRQQARSERRPLRDDDTGFLTMLEILSAWANDGSEPARQQMLNLLGGKDSEQVKRVLRAVANSEDPAILGPLLDFLASAPVPEGVEPEGGPTDGENTAPPNSPALPDDLDAGPTDVLYAKPPDSLLVDAVNLVVEVRKASVSLLQRRLRIGYTRAARLIDEMQEKGIVGPASSGSKSREVLVTAADLPRLLPASGRVVARSAFAPPQSVKDAEVVRILKDMQHVEALALIPAMLRRILDSDDVTAVRLTQWLLELETANIRKAIRDQLDEDAPPLSARAYLRLADLLTRTAPRSGLGGTRDNPFASTRRGGAETGVLDDAPQQTLVLAMLDNAPAPALREYLLVTQALHWTPKTNALLLRALDDAALRGLAVQIMVAYYEKGDAYASNLYEAVLARQGDYWPLLSPNVRQLNALNTATSASRTELLSPLVALLATPDELSTAELLALLRIIAELLASLKPEWTQLSAALQNMALAANHDDIRRFTLSWHRNTPLHFRHVIYDQHGSYQGMLSIDSESQIGGPVANRVVVSLFDVNAPRLSQAILSHSRSATGNTYDDGAFPVRGLDWHPLYVSLAALASDRAEHGSSTENTDATVSLQLRTADTAAKIAFPVREIMQKFVNTLTLEIEVAPVGGTIRELHTLPELLDDINAALPDVITRVVGLASSDNLPDSQVAALQHQLRRLLALHPFPAARDDLLGLWDAVPADDALLITGALASLAADDDDVLARLLDSAQQDEAAMSRVLHGLMSAPRSVYARLVPLLVEQAEAGSPIARGMLAAVNDEAALPDLLAALGDGLLDAGLLEPVIAPEMPRSRPLIPRPSKLPEVFALPGYAPDDESDADTPDAPSQPVVVALLEAIRAIDPAQIDPARLDALLAPRLASLSTDGESGVLPGLIEAGARLLIAQVNALKPGAPVSPALLSGLQSALTLTDDPIQRMTIATVCAKVNVLPGLLPLAFAALTDDDPALREHAVENLPTVGPLPEMIRDVLIQYLNNPDEPQQIKAARRLAVIQGDPVVSQALMQAITSPWEAVREAIFDRGSIYWYTGDRVDLLRVMVADPIERIYKEGAHQLEAELRERLTTAPDSAPTARLFDLLLERLRDRDPDRTSVSETLLIALSGNAKSNKRSRVFSGDTLLVNLLTEQTDKPDPLANAGTRFMDELRETVGQIVADADSVNSPLNQAIIWLLDRYLDAHDDDALLILLSELNKSSVRSYLEKQLTYLLARPFSDRVQQELAVLLSERVIGITESRILAMTLLAYTGNLAHVPVLIDALYQLPTVPAWLNEAAQTVSALLKTDAPDAELTRLARPVVSRQREVRAALVDLLDIDTDPYTGGYSPSSFDALTATVEESALGTAALAMLAQAHRGDRDALPLLLAVMQVTSDFPPTDWRHPGLTRLLESLNDDDRPNPDIDAALATFYGDRLRSLRRDDQQMAARWLLTAPPRIAVAAIQHAWEQGQMQRQHIDNDTTLKGPAAPRPSPFNQWPEELVARRAELITQAWRVDLLGLLLACVDDATYPQAEALLDEAVTLLAERREYAGSTRPITYSLEQRLSHAFDTGFYALLLRQGEIPPALVDALRSRLGQRDPLQRRTALLLLTGLLALDTLPEVLDTLTADIDSLMDAILIPDEDGKLSPEDEELRDYVAVLHEWWPRVRAVLDADPASADLLALLPPHLRWIVFHPLDALEQEDRETIPHTTILAHIPARYHPLLDLDPAGEHHPADEDAAYFVPLLLVWAALVYTRQADFVPWLLAQTLAAFPPEVAARVLQTLGLPDIA